MRIVDLSIPLSDDVPADPPYMKPAIEYVAHDEGAEQIANAFPGLDPAQLPEGKGWAMERVQIQQFESILKAVSLGVILLGIGIAVWRWTG